MANKERFEKSPFLQERRKTIDKFQKQFKFLGLARIGMRMCPLAHELMKMSHFKDTVVRG